MLSLRFAEPGDAERIMEFVHELALYERAPEQVRATPADLARVLSGPAPLVRVLLADWAGQPAGFALFFHTYSTWEGKRCLYLEDLFVRPEFRAKGIGKALLRRLARIAVAEDCSRFQWAVLDWNQPAIDFYESLGAKVLKEWLTCRIEGGAIAQLAD